MRQTASPAPRTALARQPGSLPYGSFAQLQAPGRDGHGDPLHRQSRKPRRARETRLIGKRQHIGKRGKGTRQDGTAVPGTRQKARHHTAAHGHALTIQHIPDPATIDSLTIRPGPILLP